MAFLRQVLKQGNRYYCLVESYRDENGRPQQRCLQWLGTYAAAINRCEQSAQLRPYLLRLAELEGRYHLPDSPPLPPRQYQVIYADPLWPTDGIRVAIKRGVICPPISDSVLSS